MYAKNAVYNIDCLEGLSEIDDGSIDCVITDPPYNLRREYGGMYDDNREDYEVWCATWFNEIQRVCSGAIAISVGVKNLPMWYRKQPPHWLYCWFKGNNMGSGSKYTNIGVWEPFLLYGNIKRMGVDGRYIPIAPQKDTGDHDCPKQIKIIQHLVKDLSEVGDVVLDPFMGSGTTAIACKQNDRDFIGFEAQQHYVDICNKRLAQETLTSFW